MTIKEVKSYLGQIERLDTVINNKLLEQEQWKAMSVSITSRLNGDPVQSSGSKQKMADAVDHCIDIEREINELVDCLIEKKKEIISVIEQLPTVEYDLLHKLYIQHMDLIEAAEMKGKSYSWATSVHGRALQNVRRILEKSEKMQTL